MKTETTSKEARLQFFSELYERARSAALLLYGELDRHFAQYKGSREIDGSSEEALTVRNITYEMIESQISSEIPMPKVDADLYSKSRDNNARSIELLLASQRDRLPFERMNDIDERYTYIYGGSVWLVEWDSSITVGNERGGVQVRVISPLDFIPEPCVFSPEDMEYCFIKRTTTRGDVKRRYLVKEDDLSRLECEYSADDAECEGDAVTVVTCFYRSDDGEVGRFVFSGEVTLSDLPRYYARKLISCSVCGGAYGNCSCEGSEPAVSEVEYESVALTAEEATRIFGHTVSRPIELSLPYYLPKHFPIIVRKNTSADGMLLGQSDCEYIRPLQQAINKVESRILQKLLRAGITPIIPEDATVSLNNAVFGQVIRMKPGESADMYGKVDTTPDISQDIIEADRLYEQAKRILGISDAFLGNDTLVGESGYAKQLRISQANSRLDSKRRMKKAAYADIYKVIFEHYLAFADEPRELSYADSLGRVHTEFFNRRDFIELDRATGALAYSDAYLFSSDSSGDEYQRDALWERNLENLRAGTLGDPAAPATLLRYWQSQERAHYPYARENVEYFTAQLEERKNYEEN
ncbi:MAG: hypothetical protein IKC34_00860 [Clostridia bacterium]|nr:hypothetical protein [Clostridia bacterium]